MERISLKQTRNDKYYRVISESLRLQKNSINGLVDVNDLVKNLNMKRQAIELIIRRYNKGEIDNNGVLVKKQLGAIKEVS